ncbi:zf-HC2 domain-containing protein [Actinospongicola halichondriae]|uniref:zf-HC2 domain-containing protein n=1 Tax=Actinospongicola halichondriae TaxID=3236844 RepID=UPI003D4C8B0F
MTDHPPSIPADGHAGDLVSARLDGELDPATAAWVDDHLDGCVACQDVAGAVEAARTWMRTSPTVDSAPLVDSVIARRHRMIGTGLAFVGAALVVLGLLAVTASVTHPDVVPDLDTLVAAHEDATHGSMDGMRPVEHAGARYATPETVGPVDEPLLRSAVYDGADLTTVLYVGAGEVTVYEQPGRLDWDRLPDGDIVRLGERRAWVRPGSPVVVVTEVGDLTVTAISDDRLRVEHVIASLGAPRRSSTSDRVHDSCQRLMEIFALGG